MVCPNCGKELEGKDFEFYYDEEIEDSSSFILCSKCGYDERDEWYDECDEGNEDNYEDICDEYHNTDAPYFYLTGNPWDV